MKCRVLLIPILLLTGVSVLAQTVGEKWTRVQTDNGEVLIEVPKELSYFYDKTGFDVFHPTLGTFPLRNMHLVNAVFDDTFISVEVYAGEGLAMEGLALRAAAKNNSLGETTINGIKMLEVVKSTNDAYCAMRFFASRKHVYVLTAASRNGSNATIKRFFESIRYTASNPTPASGTTVLSSLPVAKPEYKENTGAWPPKPRVQSKKLSDEEIKQQEKLGNRAPIFFYQGLPGYTDRARRKGVDGSVVLRITLGANGFFRRSRSLKPCLTAYLETR